MLVARSLENRPGADARLLLRARTNTQRGYQRILSFEAGRTGRFQLFCGGFGEPDIQYTARAYQILTDIDRVVPVDPAVLERTRAALLDDRRADGSWGPFPLTAFVTWILGERGEADGSLAPSLAWLDAAVAGESADPYALGLYLLATGRERPRPEAARRLAAIVETPRFRLGGPTLMGGRERTGRVEVEALAVLALLEHRTSLGVVSLLVERLLSAREGNAIWGSTAATVLTLEALLAAGEASGRGAGELTVLLDGREVGRQVWTEETSDLHALFDLASELRPGKKRVEIRTRPAEFVATVQVVASHHVPGVEAGGTGLRIEAPSPARSARAGDVVEIPVRIRNRSGHPTSMVVVQVPESAGVVLAEVAGPVSYRDEQPGRVNLYLDPIGPGEEVELRLRYVAARPGRSALPRILAYDYYEPVDRAEADPGRILVE